jgi:phosphoserine aminotransferase
MTMERFMFENFKVPANLKTTDPRFGSGPSLLPQEFVKKLAETGYELLGTSHRKPAVKNLVKSVQDGFKKYFNLPVGYEVVLGNGGATFLWDMMALGMVEQKSLHFVCGEFSEKWYKAHKKVPWIKADIKQVDYGMGIDAIEVDGYDMICTTLNETSTGVQISSLPTIKNPNTLLAVDATSGAGQIPCDISKVDMFYFSPQKVFASEGGLWIAFMSPKALARVKKIEEDKSRYIPEVMSFKLAVENSVANQTYNTPSITTFFYINEQLKLMNDLGFNKVCEMANDKAKLLYGWAEAKPYLSAYVKEEKYRSKAVATIDVDDKYPVDDMLKVLRSEKIAYDIDAYRKLGRNQFRISMFHNIKIEDLKKLTEVISMMIEGK